MPAPDPTTDRTRSHWFADRPLGVKLGASLVTMAGVGILVAGVSVDRVGSLSDAQEGLYENTIAPMDTLAGVQRDLQSVRARILQYAVADAEVRAELRQQIDERYARFETNVAAYEPYVQDAEAMAYVTQDLGFRQAPVVIAGDEHWSGFRPDNIKRVARASA